MKKEQNCFNENKVYFERERKIYCFFMTLSVVIGRSNHASLLLNNVIFFLPSILLFLMLTSLMWFASFIAEVLNRIMSIHGKVLAKMSFEKKKFLIPCDESWTEFYGA